MQVGVGDIAPEFTLHGTGDRPYSLSEFRGCTVVLAFYPGDNSPVCTMQLNAYNHDVAEFAELDAQIVGLSPQGVESHEGFSSKQGGFDFPLLADTEKVVGKLYGILGPLGFYRRSVFVVDRTGVISYAHRSATGITFKKSDELLEAVRAASKQAV
jgi:thioredoxin-dependent peroxiredoxin